MELLTAFAAAVGIYLLAKGGSFGSSNSSAPLNFSVKNVSLTTSGITPVLKINLQTWNFNSEPATIQQAQANVFINSDFYGTVTTYGNRTIAQGSSAEYPLELRMSYGQAYDELRDMWDGSTSVKLVVDVQGNITVDGQSYPVNLKHTIL